jgi:hypothetical protein
VVLSAGGDRNKQRERGGGGVSPIVIGARTLLDGELKLFLQAALQFVYLPRPITNADFIPFPITFLQ